MPRNKPPFRADVVGTILRTAPLKEARAKREKGEISAAQLKEVEDREIENIIKKQEEVGLQGRHRRRIPPLMVAFRLLRHARRRRDPVSSTTASSFRACRPGRARRASPASSAFPLIRCWSISNSSKRTAASRRKCASRARRRCISGWSRTPSRPRTMPTATPSSTIWRKPTGRRSAASTTSAAAICNSTTPPGPICARRPS